MHDTGNLTCPDVDFRRVMGSFLVFALLKIARMSLDDLHWGVMYCNSIGELYGGDWMIRL
jgi:hypothetical protein